MENETVKNTAAVTAEKERMSSTSHDVLRSVRDAGDPEGNGVIPAVEDA